MEYICPSCGSKEIIPLYAKNGIWKCLKCGFTGKPQVVDDSMKPFWYSYKELEEKR
jgi:ribosomal protein L37AE/L43A